MGDQQRCTEDGDGNHQCVADNKVDTPLCSAYLAPSTIPGAGLGVFTGIELKAGDIVGYGDVIIPVVDFLYHMSSDFRFNPLHHFDPLSNYVWDGREMGLQYETAFVNVGISSFAPGFNCAINCHLGT